MVKKFLLVFLALFLIVITISFYQEYKHFSVDEKLEMPKGCENFNAKDFFISGGSSNPQTINDIKYELARLDWLCSGGRG